MENTTKANLENKATGVVTETNQVLPKATDSLGGATSMVLNMAQFHDEIPKWGTNIKARDKYLSEFWKTENFLASTIASITMSRASLKWELSGSPKSVDQIQKVLNRSDFNRGWTSLISKLCLDLLVCDNGAFLEVIRKPPQEGRKPENSAVVALNHLPSSQCIRTGDPLKPVIYQDSDNRNHILHWYQVIALSELPIPNEDNKNIQFSFVSRVLKFAQTMKAINNYNKEKIEGRFTKSVHVVSGVSQHTLESMEEKAQLSADNSGMLNYGSSLIISTLDPGATVSHAEIQLASLPDGFDFGEMIHTYILLLSLGSGVSYTDLSPLTGGSLGSSEQVNTIQENARVKSLLLFMKNIETALKNAKIIPPNVTFAFTNSNGDIEYRDAEIKYRRAQTRSTMIADGTINSVVAAQIAVDDGDLSPAMMALMGQHDQATIVVADNERVSESDVTGIAPLDSVEEPEDVPIDVADAAAKWYRGLIENNPINAVVPIPESQLETFYVSLRNKINKEMLLGTDKIWMDDLFAIVSREAGIEAHALRYRLPDDYKLIIRKDTIVDSRGSVIYVKKYQKDTSFNIDSFLEDLSFENWGDKLKDVLNVSGEKVTKQYITEIHKLIYFSDISLLRLKLISLYYKNLPK